MSDRDGGQSGVDSCVGREFARFAEGVVAREKRGDER